MRLFAVLVCSSFVGWTAVAAAAPPAKGAEPPAPETPMQVYLVRSAQAGCEPQCPEWIAAQGKIDADSVRLFRKALSLLGKRKVPVLVDSGGGKVREALEIGRLVRGKGLDVAVTRTVITPCAPADAACRKARMGGALLGLPQAHLSKCASSCAFILAAGTRRLVGPRTLVGVHRIRSFYVYSRVLRTYRYTSSRKRLVSERRIARKVVETRTSQQTYDQIGRYFGAMGIGDPIMPLILSTPSDRLHWLTRDELRASRLATDWIDGEEFLGKAAISSVQPIPGPHGDSPGGATVPPE